MEIKLTKKDREALKAVLADIQEKYETFHENLNGKPADSDDKVTLQRLLAACRREDIAEEIAKCVYWTGEF